MYFSWKSDHTVSRWGRRVPYLWISTPGIIVTVALFPFMTCKWVLLVLVLIQLFFMDWKNSTISLLQIDLVPRNVLARTQCYSDHRFKRHGFSGSAVWDEACRLRREPSLPDWGGNSDDDIVIGWANDPGAADSKTPDRAISALVGPESRLAGPADDPFNVGGPHAQRAAANV